MEPTRVDPVALRRPVIYQIPVPCEPDVRGVCALSPHPTEPHDRWFRIAPFRGPEKAMLRELHRNPLNVALYVELIRKAVPDITDDDLNELSIDEDLPRIIGAADGKAAMVEDALKNGPSGGAFQVPSPTQRSATTTKSRPSAPASRKPTGKGGKTSTKTSGTSPSSPSTG